MKHNSPHYLAAAHSLTAGEGLVLADGTIWSHAATLGTRTKGTEFTIGAAECTNAVKVFTTGSPQKIPVDYDHGSTTNDPEIRKLRAQGGVPKAGDVLELKAVLSVADFTGELKTAAEKLSAQVGRSLDDSRNLGIWMRWKPTARALQSIKAGEYTELSIAFDEDLPNNVDGKGQGFGLWAVALLNCPFLDDMLPVAASRDTDPPPARPASREGQIMKVNLLTALAAVIAVPVTTEEEAVTELQRLQPEMTRHREFATVIGTELAETDPVKAVKKIRELRAEVETFKATAKAAATAAAKTTAESTIKEYEKQINSVPLRAMLLRQLTGELENGKKLEESETLATLKSLPKTAQFSQSTGGDVGEGLEDDQKLDATARELMTTNPRLKALVAKGDDHEAYKQALLLAEKQLKGVVATA